MIPVALLGTGSLLPGRVLDNAEVAALARPPVDPDYIASRAGILTRSWAAPGTRSADVGTQVLQQALDAAGLRADQLERVIFTSTAGGDYLTPNTASRIADQLGLTGSCDCYDLNNACTAFLSGVDIAARSVATGMGPVAVVAVEMFSDIIQPDEPRCFVIFGDAAGAAIFGPATGDEGVLGSSLRTDPTPGLTAWVDHPRWSGTVSPIRFGVSNRAMVDGAIGFLQKAADEALERAGLTIDDIDWVLPHQPNGYMFDRIVDGLGASRERTMKVVHEIGSTGCASIPFSLDRLMRSGRVEPGQTLLMVALGAGVGFGAIALRLGTPPAS